MKTSKSAIAILLAILVWTDVVGASGLSVEIAGANRNGALQRITYRGVDSHFHVVLTNRSDKPLKIWDDNNSWGYYSLSFLLKDSSGREYSAKRTPANFTRNLPVSLSIQPGRFHVIDVYFGDMDQWQGFVLPKNGIEATTIAATFEINPTPESKTQNVWTGREVSQPQSVEFERWKSK
jgi:hypothetical protein